MATKTARRGVGAAALSLLVMACGHAPLAPDASPAGDPRARPVLVTGSRIPQWIDPTSTLPATTGPVVIHSRERILATGHPDDLGAALQSLDPSIQIRHP